MTRGKPGHKPSEQTHLAITQLFERASRLELSDNALKELTGISRETFYLWRKGDRDPGLSVIEAALNAVNLKLVAVPIRRTKR